ncbi:SGNH hydrolase domain-containing protein [Arthrobacter sp. SA17]
MDPRNECQEPFGPPLVTNVGANEAPWFDAPECAPAADPIRVNDLKLLTECDFTGGAPAAATVWLVGDSHAEQWKAAIYELARHKKWEVKETLLGGCPFIDAKRIAFMGSPSTDPKFQQRCLDWGSRSLSAS